MPNSAASSAGPVPGPDTFTVKVDGISVTVPRLSPDWQGTALATTMLQACEAAGVRVPHYCYHRQLPVAGNCRMCLVEYGTPALGPDRQPLHNPDCSLVISKSPRPAIACATPLMPGMEIYTDTAGVKQMRQGVLEFLLINHPLDCQICDQAGECKLQEYAVDYGQTTSRFVETKVHKPKQVELGPRIMLDDERCILCSRCLRFTREIVRDDALGILNRGSYSSIAAFPGRPFANNYTLNTVDLCPVGALTAKDFRFQMRVWFLKETKSLCPGCGTGCNILIGSRENRIYRFTPRRNDAVNSCWMCDTGRLDYQWIGRPERLAQLAGSRVSAPDWSTVLTEIAAALRRATPNEVAMIASARLSNEALYQLRRLAQLLGAPTDIVPRIGEADHLLVHADRNPNSTGARLLGLSAEPGGANLPRFAEAIRRGVLKTLLVWGEDVTQHGIEPADLARLETLVVSDVLPSPTVASAHFVLPACAPAESRGTFTNANGRVQRFVPAVQAPGAARPEWEFLGVLLSRMIGRETTSAFDEVFQEMAREVPAFHGLTWSALGDAGLAVRC